MDINQLKEIIEEALYEYDCENDGEDRPLINSIVDFDREGLLTRDDGLVIKFTDDSEFQLTIQKTN